MIDYFISQIKEHPEIAVGGVIATITLYGTKFWPEYSMALTFICIASIYAMLSRSIKLDHTLKSLARAIPASIVVAVVIVVAAFSVGEILADPIQADGRQSTQLILLMSAVGVMVIVPSYLVNFATHEIAKSPWGKWLAWRIRSQEQKEIIADCTAGIFFVCLAIDVTIRSAV